jgi:hypothetical protein
MGGQTGSFGTSNGQVQEAWERDRNDQASIWQVYSSIKIFAQIGETWKQYGGNVIGFLYKARILVDRGADKSLA